MLVREDVVELYLYCCFMTLLLAASNYRGGFGLLCLTSGPCKWFVFFGVFGLFALVRFFFLAVGLF